ncbi:MAG TPA: aminotransferase class V-fold PLP-dependent enzyme [Acidimicrobiales bacterium]|nr:aminotransferase class V-fold PLP-dependent enzyme [Acidimicrobiales bacterium]
MSAIDVGRARAETPGCDGVVHLNHAGCSLPPRVVLDAQVEWLRSEAVTGGYELAAAREDDLARACDEVAALVGAAPEEIALVENATFGWHQAFWSLPLRPGDRILTAGAEYATGFISFLQAERRRGVRVEVVPDDDDGQVSVDALARMLDGGDGPVGLVAVTHVPTNGGLVNPAEEIGRLTRAAGVPYLLDACQSVGQMPVDVQAIGCDLLSASGRKFLRAPRGTGFLYARGSLLDRMEPAFLDLDGATWVAPDRYEVRPDARRFENWESNLAARVGLGEAVAYARGWGLDAIGARVAGVAAGLRGRLAEVPGVVVRDKGRRRCGIVTFTVDGVEARAVQAHLAAAGINVSVSLPSATLLDARARDLPPLVRASVHYLTTDDELDAAVRAVAELAR